MASTTRRSVLKGMAGMAVSNALGPLAAGLTPFCGNRITLNVILHGLFVLDFQNDHIELLAPNVKEHIYRAGSWDYPKTFGLCSPSDAKYKLTGVTGRSTCPKLSRDFMAVLSKEEISADQHKPYQINSKASRISVELPLPEEVHPLRSLRADPYAGKDSKFIRCDGLSLCQVLVYPRAKRSASVSESPQKNPGPIKTPWQIPERERNNKTANLHIWAEPAYRVDPGHEFAAYQELKKLTCLDIDLVIKDSPPVDCCVDVPGVYPFEEQGWAEWASGGEGTRPVNCGSQNYAQSLP